MGSGSINFDTIGRTIGEDVLVDLAALAIGGFVSFSLILWDFVCYLPDEIRLLKDFRKIEWRVPDPWAFLLSRYSALTYAVLVLFNLTLKTEHCQFATSLAQVTSIAVVAAGGVLAAKRAVTLWNGEGVMVVPMLGTLYIFVVASWIAAATQHRSIELRSALPAFGTNCRPLALAPWYPVSYGASTTLFTAILVLVLYRLVSQRTDRVLNSGLTPLNRAYIWYLTVNAATSTALFVVTVNWYGRWTTETAKRIATPFFVVLIAATNQRIYLNSHADSVLRKRRVQELTNIDPPTRSPHSSPRLRWSFVPIRKPVPHMHSPTMAPTSYPRSPLSPPSVPVTSLPPQHIASLEKSRTVSISSGSGSSSIIKSPASQSDSISIFPPTSPSSAGASEDASTFDVGSPVSTIGFGSPPGSPPVLGLPFPSINGRSGGRKQRQRQRQTTSSFGSVLGGSQPETPNRGLTRLPSGKSGWVS